MARSFGTALLGSLPLDPLLLAACEAGQAYVVRHADSKGQGVPAFMAAASAIVRAVEGESAGPLSLTAAASAAAAPAPAE